MTQKVIYLIGSLRDPFVPLTGVELRKLGFDVFDDWYAAGPEADDKWRQYEEDRGRTYREALTGYAAKHVFQFDLTHLRRAHIAVLLAPAGRSCHLEFGFMIGAGKPGYILLPPNSDRWDVMYSFATGVFNTFDELRAALTEETQYELPIL